MFAVLLRIRFNYIFLLQGEATLQEIQAALHDIAHSQLEIQKLEASD
jgi:hypothetical protein